MSAVSMTSNKPLRKAPRKQRIPLSCEPCRSRKLKCNRQQPCQNCSVRDNPRGCIFLGPEGGPGPTLTPAYAESMQQRIDKLESLVTSLVAQSVETDRSKPPLNGNLENDSSSTGSETSPLGETPATSRGSQESSNGSARGDEIHREMGVLTVDDKSSIYRGSTHWGEVLNELHELKSYWHKVQDVPESFDAQVTESTDVPGLLVGIVQPISRQELLASVPSKPACDKMMTRFFDDEDSPAPTFHILHKPAFMKTYEAHWAKPEDTKVMWLGLLFSILDLVMVSYDINQDEPPEYQGISRSLAELYQLRTSQCLMLGDITKCAPFTVETMIYNTMAEWGRRSCYAPRVWMMVGLVTRVALQMGYHMDPSHFPDLSVFEGEMRRRIWCFVQRTDGLTSFLMGLPSMVQSLDYDTADPRNLWDWELSEDMTVLPPERPFEELTPVSYLIAKGRITAILGKIHTLLSGFRQYPYERVLELDDQLQKVWDELPPRFKMDRLEVLDSRSIVNRQAQLRFLFLQGMCVLHRKFFVRGRLDPRYERSYKRCTESAINLLKEQHFLYMESKKPRSLVAKHWFRISHTSQDFILSAMILVLDIKHRRNDKSTENMEAGGVIEPEVLFVLQSACQIWKDESEKKKSPEATQVYHVLSNMRKLLGIPDPVETPVLDNFPSPVHMNNWVPAPSLDMCVPELSMDFDWDIWDSYVEGTSFEDAYGGMPSQY